MDSVMSSSRYRRLLRRPRRVMTGGKRLWTLRSSQLSSRTEEVTQVYTSALEHIVIAAGEQATACHLAGYQNKQSEGP